MVAGLGGYQMFDSLAVDGEGHVCVATLITGAVSDIWPDGSRVDQYMLPDMMVTNVCFGGRELRTAFATLSMGGTLVSFEWPRPGCRCTTSTAEAVRMKVGVLQFFSWSRRIPLATVYERAFARIEIMDQTGLRLRLAGRAPLQHLQRLPVDQRHGRARGGADGACGSAWPSRWPPSTTRCGWPRRWRSSTSVRRAGQLGRRARFRPGGSSRRSGCRSRRAPTGSASAWRSCWRRGERARPPGEVLEYDAIEVLPKPLQQPHPPVWLAATSPDSIRRAARRGYDILQGPHATHAEIGPERALDYQILREHGFPAESRVIPTARLLAVGKTEQEAEEVARAGARGPSSYSNPTKRAGPPAPHQVGVRIRSPATCVTW